MCRFCPVVRPMIKSRDREPDCLYPGKCSDTVVRSATSEAMISQMSYLNPAFSESTYGEPPMSKARKASFAKLDGSNENALHSYNGRID
jgi:hypothetical protein